MAEKRERRQSGSSARGSKDEHQAIDRRLPTPEGSPPWQEPRGIQKGIADADKIARADSTEEKVRDTPPAGAWNDTSGD